MRVLLHALCCCSLLHCSAFGLAFGILCSVLIRPARVSYLQSGMLAWLKATGNMIRVWSVLGPAAVGASFVQGSQLLALLMRL